MHFQISINTLDVFKCLLVSGHVLGLQSAKYIVRFYMIACMKYYSFVGMRTFKIIFFESVDLCKF
jgi:uncharacterized protein (UPF0262 family)